MSENKIRAEIEVFGFVQGVGYRFFVWKKAIEFGLTGFVRNRWDGNVELCVEGEEKSIMFLIEQLRIGPSRSSVTDIKIIRSDFKNEFNDFKIKG